MGQTTGNGCREGPFATGREEAGALAESLQSRPRETVATRCGTSHLEVCERISRSWTPTSFRTTRFTRHRLTTKTFSRFSPGKSNAVAALAPPAGLAPTPKPFCGAKNSLTRQRIPRHLVQDWHHFCVALRHAPLFQPLPDVISTMTERTLSNRLHFSEPIVTVQTAFGHEIRVKHYALHS